MDTDLALANSALAAASLSVLQEHVHLCVLQEQAVEAMLEYALRHGHVHLGKAGEAGDALAKWSNFFLERRPWRVETASCMRN